MTEADLLRGARDALSARGLGSPRVAMVLGSGLSDFAERLEAATEIGFDEVPHWPASAVEGHRSRLVVGSLDGLRVACLAGRVHLYEGWSPAEIVRAVRTLRLAGVGVFLLTNAAGGVSSAVAAGELMIVRDHLNYTGQSPLVGRGEPELGPRFPDQSAVYSPALRQLLHAVDPDLREGVYAGNLGPQYETPAEIEAQARAGADAVGMSTVLEAIALSAMGAEVAGLSLISNLAAGRSDTALSHDEVLEAGRAAAERMTTVVRGFCRAVAQRGVE